MKILTFMFFLIVAVSSLYPQDQEDKKENITDEKTFLLRVFKFEGLIGISEDYLLRYGRLKTGQYYTKTELTQWTALYKVRVESDIRISFVKPDLFFSSEEDTVELYILVEPNNSTVIPSGGNAYMSFTFIDTFVDEALFILFAGYNRQSVLWNVPYVGQSDFGLQLSGGHHIQNHFDFKDDIYSDFFLQKYLYWHPLPEVHMGVYQQVDTVFYYNGYQGNRDFLGRWKLGLRLQSFHKALENNFGYYLNGDVGWRPLGQFSQELSGTVKILLYGHFDRFRPYLNLVYAQVSPRGETQKSFIIGSRKKGLLLRSAATLDLVFLPFPSLFSIFDIGVISGSSIGIGSTSWEQFKAKTDFEHSIFVGPYFSIINPGINVGVRLGLLSDDFWQSSNFIFSLVISGI